MIKAKAKLTFIKKAFLKFFFIFNFKLKEKLMPKCKKLKKNY